MHPSGILCSLGFGMNLDCARKPQAVPTIILLPSKIYECPPKKLFKIKGKHHKQRCFMQGSVVSSTSGRGPPEPPKKFLPPKRNHLQKEMNHLNQPLEFLGDIRIPFLVSICKGPTQTSWRFFPTCQVRVVRFYVSCLLLLLLLLL